MSKDFSGSHTEENLKKAFLHEVNAGTLYTYYADQARLERKPYIAEILEAIAATYEEHARHEFNFLGGVLDTVQNLEDAIDRESDLAKNFYPEIARTAENEGFTEIASFLHSAAKVKEKHGLNLQTVFDSLNKPGLIKGRTPGHSSTRLAQMVIPGATNTEGFVHSNDLLKIMGDAATVAASRHCLHAVAMSDIEDIVLNSPAHPGTLVTADARLVFTSQVTMEIQVKATVEDTVKVEKHEAASAHYIFSAVNSDGKSSEVPPLIVITEKDALLYKEGLARYEARKSNNK